MICHKLGGLLIQLPVCLTVFFLGGNCCDLIATNTFASSNNHPINVQIGGATKMQKHSTPTALKNTDPSDEPIHSSWIDGMTIELGKNQTPIIWFHYSLNAIYSFARKWNLCSDSIAAAYTASKSGTNRIKEGIFKKRLWQSIKKRFDPKSKPKLRSDSIVASECDLDSDDDSPIEVALADVKTDPAASPSALGQSPIHCVRIESNRSAAISNPIKSVRCRKFRHSCISFHNLSQCK